MKVLGFILAVFLFCVFVVLEVESTKDKPIMYVTSYHSGLQCRALKIGDEFLPCAETRGHKRSVFVTRQVSRDWQPGRGNR